MFSSQPENLGILCRGKSLLGLSEIEKKFEMCYIVNNFNKEIYHFEDILKKKEIIHFVNRLKTAVLKKKTYQKFKINTVQMAAPFKLLDKNFMTSYLIYKFLSLNVKTMSKSFLHKFHFTGKEAYKNKFPNTGILSILYATEVLNVKNVYIIGLDFYSLDYLYRSKFSNPLEIQHQKFLDLNMINFFLKYVENKKDTMFYLRTGYNFSLVPKNLILI